MQKDKTGNRYIDSIDGTLWALNLARERMEIDPEKVGSPELPENINHYHALMVIEREICRLATLIGTAGHCEDCENSGYLIMNPGGMSGFQIQRCDQCDMFSSDFVAEQAALESLVSGEKVIPSSGRLTPEPDSVPEGKPGEGGQKGGDIYDVTVFLSVGVKIHGVYAANMVKAAEKAEALARDNLDTLVDKRNSEVEETPSDTEGNYPLIFDDEVVEYLVETDDGSSAWLTVGDDGYIEEVSSKV